MLPRRTLLAGLFVATATSAAPVELNPNAQFDIGVAGLVLAEAPVGGILLWSPLDLTGRISSGAALIAGPAGRYVVRLCGQIPALPFARYDYAASARVRSPNGAATMFGELIPMFGGDDPVNDGPCARPWADYASAYAFPAPDADFRLAIPNGWLWDDLAYSLVIHKPAGDFLLDALSLSIDDDPIASDGFE